MSLLIDALRKAEQIRRESELQRERLGPPAAEDGAESRQEPALPPAPPAAAPEPAADPAYQEAIYGERARPPEANAGTSPRAARRLFEVKQAPRQRLFWPLVGSLTSLAVVALGGYLWWELQPRGLMTADALPSAPPQSRPLPSAQAASLAAAAQALTVPPSATPQEPAATQRRELAREAPSRGSFTPPPAEPVAASGLGAIRRGSPEPDALPAALTGAYAAYNAGDMSRATTLYNQVLGQDPHNRDALDGMGAIALRLGREAEAEAWFRRSLAADPNDAVAQAGLAQLRGRGQPGEESRMKSLIAAQPQAAPGHFALGNALAAQDRWPEAQQAYFDAHTLDPGNPDYLFNLAVSLDQLHHYSLARRFYAEALAAATTRAASFERAPVEARLQALDEAR